MTFYAEEKFSQAWPELKPLFDAHWAEQMAPTTSDVFNPDVKRYIQYNEIGYFKLYTARKDGKMIGNMGVYITPSMHTQKLIAQEDTWYVSPKYRGWVSLKFTEYVTEELKKLGVTSARLTTPPDSKGRRLLEHIGFNRMADCYIKEF